MGSPYITSNRGGGRRPQLPAFCRTRRPTTVAVTASSLVGLRGLPLSVGNFGIKVACDQEIV